MAQKVINLAKTIAKSPKSKTNQVSLKYVYELNYDGEYYYIYRTYYQNNKLISVHNHGVSKNREQMIKRYKDFSSDIFEIL